MATTTVGAGQAREPSFGQFRAFVVLAEELHFRRAAARLEIGQPALSETIHRLEMALGSALLMRTSRRVALTEAGQELLPRARDLLARLEFLRASAGSSQPSPPHLLGVGVVANGMAELTRPIIAAVRARNPGLRVVVRELACDPTAFFESRFDVGLAYLPFAEERIELHALATEPRGMLVPAGHPLAGAEDASIDDFLDDPFIATRGMPVIRDYWLAVDQRGGVPPRIGGHAVAVMDWLHGIIHGGLVTTASRSSTRSFPVPGMAMAGVTGLPPCTHVVAVRAGDQRPVVESFIATARDVVNQLSDAAPGFTPIGAN